jgi:hypothetical protein
MTIHMAQGDGQPLLFSLICLLMSTLRSFDGLMVGFSELAGQSQLRRLSFRASLGESNPTRIHASNNSITTINMQAIGSKKGRYH